MLELLRLALHALGAAVRSRRDLALDNLVLRHQLQVALRTNAHPRLRAPDRVFWVWLRHRWPNGAGSPAICPFWPPPGVTTVLEFDNSFDNNAGGRPWLQRHAEDDSANTITGAPA